MGRKFTSLSGECIFLMLKLIAVTVPAAGTDGFATTFHSKFYFLSQIGCILPHFSVILYHINANARTVRTFPSFVIDLLLKLRRFIRNIFMGGKGVGS